MTSENSRIALTRSLSTGTRKPSQQGLTKAWFSRLSIESLYASLLKPQVELTNPALVSFIRAEGLPELVSDGFASNGVDIIAEYIQLHLKYVNKYSYSSQMAKLVQEKGIKVNKLWFVMSNYKEDSAKIISNLSSFISNCLVGSIGFDFIMCSKVNYSEEMIQMLDLIDQTLQNVNESLANSLTFQNLNSPHNSILPNLLSSVGSKQNLKLEPPTTFPDDYDFPNVDVNFSSLDQTLDTQISPNSRIGDFQQMLISCPELNTEESPVSRSTSIISISSQQTPTPLTSPSINIRINPFETKDQIELPKRSLTIGNLSRRKSFLAKDLKVENLCFKLLDKDLLFSCLLYSSSWRLKTIQIQAQENFKSLEDAIKGNLNLIKNKEVKSLPMINVKFKNNEEFNKLVFQVGEQEIISKIDNLREIYPSITFYLCLNSIFFTTLDCVNTIEDIMKHIKYNDIKMIIQDVRRPILDYNTNIRNWRQIIALLENLETVKYISNIDLNGVVMFDSWNSSNWMWKLYTKLKKMSFKFELLNEKLSPSGNFNQLAIEIPQHVKCLNIDLDLLKSYQGGDHLKEFNISDKITMKDSFLAQFNINLLIPESQPSIKLIFDGIDNPVKKMSIKSNFKIDVNVQTSKQLFDDISLTNCNAIIIE